MENCTIKSTREQIGLSAKNRTGQNLVSTFSFHIFSMRERFYIYLNRMSMWKSLYFNNYRYELHLSPPLFLFPLFFPFLQYNSYVFSILVFLNDHHPDKQFIQMKACCWMEVLCSGHNQYCIWPGPRHARVRAAS